MIMMMCFKCRVAKEAKIRHESDSPRSNPISRVERDKGLSVGNSEALLLIHRCCHLQPCHQIYIT